MVNKGSILLIEDNEDQINLVSLLNREFNFKIDVVHNLKEFDQIIVQSSYDIILCDIDLSYASEGLDILEVYKLSQMHGKIFAYTLSSNDEDFFIQKGFERVIKKNMEELKQLFKDLERKSKKINFFLPNQINTFISKQV